jgi:hypothetical protein
MTWFSVILHGGFIEKVEVERFTQKNVWVKRGYQFVKKYPRIGQYEAFYSTFEEARSASRDCLDRKIDEAQSNLKEYSARRSRLMTTEVEFLPEPPKYDTPLLLSATWILENPEA